MSYSAGETLILTKVRTCAGFTSSNTSQANWKLLNQGKAKFYAILHIGPFVSKWITPKVHRDTYTTVIELWQRYKDDSTSTTDLYTNFAALLTGLMPSKRMGDATGNVDDASVSGGDELEEMWTASGGPAWLRMKINIVWSEDIEETLTS